jgi:hypothetical protein
VYLRSSKAGEEEGQVRSAWWKSVRRRRRKRRKRRRREMEMEIEIEIEGKRLQLRAES